MQEICNVIMIIAIVAALISAAVCIYLKIKSKRIKNAVVSLICAVLIAVGAGVTGYVVEWTVTPAEQLSVEKKDESECTAPYDDWVEYAQSYFKDFDAKITYSQNMLNIDYSDYMNQKQTEAYLKAAKKLMSALEQYGDGADRLPPVTGALLKWNRGMILFTYSLADTPHITPELLNDYDIELTKELYNKYF
jgi:hypothetical protein